MFGVKRLSPHLNTVVDSTFQKNNTLRFRRSLTRLDFGSTVPWKNSAAGVGIDFRR